MTSNQLRLAFAGTPELAARVLASLIDKTNHSVSTVYTQPDRPAGRGRKLHISPVKEMALETGIPVLQPTSKSELRLSADPGNIDALIVVAYGMIIPEEVLTVPKFGCLNIHMSLLPRWRGAAPIQRAIEFGDTETGVTIMQMDAGLDTGPVLRQCHCPLEKDETAASLHDKLARLGTDAIIRTLDDLVAGTAVPTPQDESRATYASKVTKQEANIDWNRNADEIERMVRAFNPAPVAFTRLGDLDMRIWEVDYYMNETGDRSPGTVIDCTRAGIRVACKHGILIIKKLQLPGKRPMDVADILNGKPDFLQSQTHA